MSHAMTQSEREGFLADVHVGIIGIIHSEHALAVPIWYGYEPGGDVWLTTNPSSIKGKALEASRRFSLCAQTEDPPYKYVTVEGAITSIDQASEETKRTMAHRYLGPEIGDMYIEGTASGAAGDRVYRMTPDTWYTVDYAKDFG
jgi:nitroimidazol reductase NimA-like FMN-containing flavoprotein (pyridoxamine 5'-phosphate oxidase superfamily)